MKRLRKLDFSEVRYPGGAVIRDNAVDAETAALFREIYEQTSCFTSKDFSEMLAHRVAIGEIERGCEAYSEEVRHIVEFAAREARLWKEYDDILSSVAYQKWEGSLFDSEEVAALSAAFESAESSLNDVLFSDEEDAGVDEALYESVLSEIKNVLTSEEM